MKYTCKLSFYSNDAQILYKALELDSTNTLSTDNLELDTIIDYKTENKNFIIEIKSNDLKNFTRAIKYVNMRTVLSIETLSLVDDC